MDPFWLLPVAREAYKSREEIKSGWGKITTRLRGRKSSIVFTGMAGVGKTVLLDYLSGTAYQPNYAPPGRSETVEKKQITAPKQRINALVVPGPRCRCFTVHDQPETSVHDR